MKILFFASLREKIGTEYKNITLSENISVKELIVLLKSEYGDDYFPNNTICAVNHSVANDYDIINDNDEVAFYPPVTGG